MSEIDQRHIVILMEMKKNYVVSAGRDSSVALDYLRMTENFTKKVLTIVHGIPKGSVMTYREVAEIAGSPRAYRAVGNIRLTAQ